MTELAPLPDELLGPVFEAAAAMLRALPVAAVPGTLRPLLRFDARGMTRGPARKQLRRALVGDANFREQVFAVLGALPEVAGVLAGWDVSDALAFANAAAERDELALLASALLALAPAGAELGLGVVLAVDAGRRRARADADEGRRTAARVVDLEEAMRRSDAARLAAERERDAVAEALRGERRARREREERAVSDGAGADARIRELEAELAAAHARVPVVPAPVAAPPTARPARTRARGGAPKRRARPTLPGGLVADTPEGAGAMLRRGAALLVVDGYNVTKTAAAMAPATAAASLELERESLVRTLESLHLATGVEVIVVFDGDDVAGSSRALRRTGVRVVFSRSGVEADSVVVEIVAATPLETPVVVASSDRWVREHAETFGAVVVSAATLVSVLRRPPS